MCEFVCEFVMHEKVVWFKTSHATPANGAYYLVSFDTASPYHENRAFYDKNGKWMHESGVEVAPDWWAQFPEGPRTK